MRPLEQQHTPSSVRPPPEPDAAFTLVISSGVTSSGLTLTPTEFELVLGGGIAVSNTVDSGGQVTVSARGLTQSDTILSGGSEIVSAGGDTVSATVSAGGLISGAGVLDKATIYGFAAGLSVGPDDDFFGSSFVESGGLVSALAVVNDGFLFLESAGSSIATRVSGGGSFIVESGGVVSASVVYNGGVLEVAGEADATRISAGAYAYVGSGGSSGTPLLNSATIVGAGALLVIDSGSIATGTQIYAGATVDLGNNATLSNTVMRGGTLSAQLGSVISGLTIAEGASVTLLPDAVAQSVALASGTLNLGTFGVVGGLTMSAGGVLNDNGAVQDGGVSNEPGKTVWAGQIAGSGLLIELGGGTLELTGSTSGFTGELIVGDATVELGAAGGVNSGSIDFDPLIASGANTVQIDAANRPATGTTYGAALIDFNSNFDRLDLAGLALVSGATAKVSGDTLTLVDGAYTASFTLASTRAQHYGVESDGAGGLDIRGSVGSAVPLVEAAAGFSAPMGIGGAFETTSTQLAPTDAVIGAVGADSRRPLG